MHKCQSNPFIIKNYLAKLNTFTNRINNYTYMGMIINHTGTDLVADRTSGIFCAKGV